MYVSRGATTAARARASAAVLGAALLLAACSSSEDPKQEGDGDKAGAGITQQPKEADPFWVNPDGNAAKQVAAYRKSGKDDEAGQIRKIAQQPTGEWIGPENPEQEARGFTEAADKAAVRPFSSSTTSRTATAASTPRAVPPTATPTGPGSTVWPRASATARRR